MAGIPSVEVSSVRDRVRVLRILMDARGERMQPAL